MGDSANRRSRPRSRARAAKNRQALPSEANSGPGAQGDPGEIARTLALRSLNAAPRTRAQLADLLASRDVPEDAASECLDRFTELGLIDDAEFARSWVRSRHTTRHLPRRALRYELQRKGVSEEHIEAALETIDSEDELVAATMLAQRKARATASLDWNVRRRRIVGALMRRGFTSDVAAQALAAALETEEDASFAYGE